MDCLFDISIPNIIEELSKDRLRSKEAKIEDINFIIDQRGKRKMYIGYEDLKYSKSVNDKILREKRSAVTEALADITLTLLIKICLKILWIKLVMRSLIFLTVVLQKKLNDLA